MKLPEDLFELTKEQEELSLSIYGKTIKCLVAPYHSYGQLEKALPYSPTTFLFPERDIDHQRERGFINLIASKDDKKEYRIVTTSMSIIGDMIDGCVRVLTERDEIVDCPIKTFAANIHSIQRHLLENGDFAKTKKGMDNASYRFTDKLLKEILAAQTTGATDAEKKDFTNRASMVGEEVIGRKLKSMVDELPELKKVTSQ